jgi:hypothetical protein
MALTPVAYTKNWKDTAGSQNAALDVAAKIDPPTVVDTVRPEPDVRLTVGGSHPMKVDWGDGTIEDTNGAVLNHTYTRNGSYRIRTWYVDYPDMFVDVVKRISYFPAALTLDATAILLDASVAITGQVYPITLDWGDGTVAFLPNDSALEAAKTHTYAADGTFLVSVLDARVRHASESITIAGTPAVVVAPAPPVETPWASMTRHADIDEFAISTRQNQPEGWTTMTIAEKKAWLDENFAVADEETAGAVVNALSKEN